MIRLQDLTPDVYYKQSRDFQFIGRLYDLVLNSVKTNTELIYALPLSENSDERLIDLMTMTLGFKSKHNYNVQQLTALCSAFAEIIRNKGNIQSIEKAGNALLNAEGIKDKIECDFEYDETGNIDYTTINLFIPQDLKDINLFRDLLTYILPAGMSCNIIREFRTRGLATSYVGIGNDAIQHYNETNINEVSKIPQIGENIDIAASHARDTQGLFIHSGLYQGTKPVLPNTVKKTTRKRKTTSKQEVKTNE